MDPTTPFAGQLGITYLLCWSITTECNTNCDSVYVIFYNPSDIVVDIQSNIYDIITIGSQVWMAENLRTTKYNDGTAIPLVTDNGIWFNLDTPAYSWFNNDEINYGETYGAMYNWYAVDLASNGGKNICPVGWHVPSAAEWTTMENYLIANGFNYDGTTIGDKIAKSIATDSGWEISYFKGSIGNTDYTSFRNKSGYSALPGGLRSADGRFLGLNEGCQWWSNTKVSSTTATYIYTYKDYVDLRQGDPPMRIGLSIRCIKD